MDIGFNKLQNLPFFSKPIDGGFQGVGGVGEGLFAPKINTEGNQGINRTLHFANQPKTDAYAQYDNTLEHGFAGEQYKNGKMIGGLLNYEA